MILITQNGSLFLISPDGSIAFGSYSKSTIRRFGGFSIYINKWTYRNPSFFTDVIKFSNSMEGF